MFKSIGIILSTDLDNDIFFFSFLFSVLQKNSGTCILKRFNSELEYISVYLSHINVLKSSHTFSQ